MNKYKKSASSKRAKTPFSMMLKKYLSFPCDATLDDNDTTMSMKEKSAFMLVKSCAEGDIEAMKLVYKYSVIDNFLEEVED